MAVVDIDMDEETFVGITRKMVDLLVEIDPEMYQPYVIEEGTENVLYVELIKALYGTLRAARLFWERLSQKLVAWGTQAVH